MRYWKSAEFLKKIQMELYADISSKTLFDLIESWYETAEFKVYENNIKDIDVKNIAEKMPVS